MPWAAAGAIGAAAIGAVSSATKGTGSSSSGSTTTSASSPWAPQQLGMTTALEGADNAYTSQMANGPYTGSLYSGESADSQAASQNAEQVAASGGALASQDAATGATLTGQAGNYVNNAANIAANGIAGPNAALQGQLSNVATGATAPVNSGLSGALNTAATAGANAVGGYNAGLSSVAAQGQADQTSKLAADASQYANSGYAAQSVAAANTQIQNTLNETTNPGINRQAALGGNMNSSRAGMAEAMANSNAAMDMGSTDASIENNAYNSGLSTAAQQNTSGLNTALAANTAGLSGNSNLALGTANNQVSATNTQDAAATSGLASNLGYETANANTQLAANAQLGSGVATGLTANNDAQNIGVSDSSQLAASGALQQANTTAQDAANYQSWLNTNNYGMNTAAGLMGVENAPKYNASGQTISSTSTPPTNVAGAVGALGTTVASQFAPGGALNQAFNGSSGTASPLDANGNATSAGGQTLQSMGLYNPLPTS